MRDLRRGVRSYLLTAAVLVDGERAEPVPSRLLLEVPYTAFARGVLSRTSSYGHAVRTIGRCSTNQRK